MGNKLYYACMTPMLIIGFLLMKYYPGSESYVLWAMILVLGYFAWKDFKIKLALAEGEEEIRHVTVPMILLILVLILGIISLITQYM